MSESTNKESSKPVYKIKEGKNVYVKMRDGVCLAVDVFRPDTEGKFPVLLALSPYGKDIQAAIPPQGPGSYYSYGALEAGNTRYIVSRGYVHIIGDIRGTGKSEGKYKCMFSKLEAEDGYDLVEWAAQQPWCDGNVGMVGISYFAAIQLIVAAEQPPHLKAIFPFDSPGDFYRDAVYHGGVLNAFNWLLWRQIAIRDYALASAEEMSPEELEARTEEAKKNKDLLMYSWIYQTLETPPMQPHFFDELLHPYDGPFWWERSVSTRYDKVKIPTYCGSGWWAYSMWHLCGAFRNYLGIDAPKKLTIGPMTFLERPFHQYHDIIIRWFDHWLKGIDTGIMDEPPVRLYIMGAERWRDENEWPLARTQWTKFYLHSWERLSPEPETFYEEPDCFVQQPPIMTSKIQTLTYLTHPLAEEVEVTGPIALYLYASIDQDDTSWIITLKDVDEDGSERLLTAGWLKASHRAVDESKSKPYQPYHPHTEESVEKIEPGKIYEYAIEVRPTSNVFKVGHRIKLEIASIDLPVGFRGLRIIPPYHIASSKTTLHRVYRDEKYPSHLLLPIIPKA